MIWLVLVCLWKKNNKIHWFQLSETLERLCVCPHEMFILHNKAEIIQKRTPPWDSLGYLATFSFMAGWYFHSQFGMYFIAFFFFFFQYAPTIKAEREKETQFWKGHYMFVNTKNKKMSTDAKLILAILMTEKYKVFISSVQREYQY